MMEGHLYIRKTKTACLTGHSELSEVPDRAGCFARSLFFSSDMYFRNSDIIKTDAGSMFVLGGVLFLSCMSSGIRSSFVYFRNGNIIISQIIIFLFTFFSCILDFIFCIISSVISIFSILQNMASAN